MSSRSRSPREERRRQAEPGAGADAYMAGALAAVLLAGLFVRSLATLLPPLVVGDDGAYYLVQVRALLRDGALAFPDFPLLFYLQAAAARILSLAMEPRDAIVAAVRITDTASPAGAGRAGVPLRARVRAPRRPPGYPRRGRGAGRRRGGRVGQLPAHGRGHDKERRGAAARVPLRVASYRWLCGGRRSSLALAAAWFVLASLTHMGGFVLSSTFGASLLAAGLATPAIRPRVRLPGAVLLASLAGCLATVHALDPERAQRLVHAVLAPGWLFAGSPAALAPGVCRTKRPGGPRAGGDVGRARAGRLGVVALWRHRLGMDAATRALLVASTIAALASRRRSFDRTCSSGSRFWRTCRA